MEVNGQLHVPAALTQGKRPCYPLDKRLGGSQSRSGHEGEEKNSQPLPGLEPPRPSAIPLSYPGFFKITEYVACFVLTFHSLDITSSVTAVWTLQLTNVPELLKF
jgi:hypothetical protein